MDKMYARKWEGEKKQLKTPTEAPTCNIDDFARSLLEIHSAFFEASSLGQLWRSNVSMLPLSSPSLRLLQIRRRKKRTCDDMFSELMQSSCTNRAQLNAWRHPVAESRKALSERDEKRQDAILRLIGEQTDMLRRLVELQENQ